MSAKNRQNLKARHLAHAVWGKARAFFLLWRLTNLRDTIRFAWHRHTGNELWLTLRHSKRRFLLRPNNSDFAVLLQTFMEDGCKSQAWLAQPKVIVDAGANIGATTLLLNEQYPEATVVAIEPEPENFRLLEANTQALPGVVRMRSGLWPHSARLSLEQSAGKSWACRTEESTEGECPSVTLNQLFETYGCIDLLKLDIEGAEWPLFEGTALDWLARIPVVMVELHGADKVARLKRALAGRETQIHPQHEKHVILFAPNTPAEPESP